MSLIAGTRLGVSEIVGKGGPVSARFLQAICEPWRGLAVTQARTRC